MTVAGVRYRINLSPWDRPLLGRPREPWTVMHANQRPPRHPAGRNRIVQDTIAAIAWKARAAGLREPVPHLVVALVWVPHDYAGDRDRRDPDNLGPGVKIVCDALARGPAKRRRGDPGLDLVPDDTPRYMTRRKPDIVGPTPELPAGLWVIVDVCDGPPDDAQL